MVEVAEQGYPFRSGWLQAPGSARPQPPVLAPAQPRPLCSPKPSLAVLHCPLPPLSPGCTVRTLDCFPLYGITCWLGTCVWGGEAWFLLSALSPLSMSSLGLGFSICEMGMLITVSTPRGCCGGKRDQRSSSTPQLGWPQALKGKAWDMAMKKKKMMNMSENLASSPGSAHAPLCLHKGEGCSRSLGEQGGWNERRCLASSAAGDWFYQGEQARGGRAEGRT